MEVTNRSQTKHIPLVCGARVAQIVFHATTGAEQNYATKGKYQTTPSDDLATLQATWKPEMMLPRMWDDWETKLPVHERPGSLVKAPSAEAAAAAAIVGPMPDAPHDPAACHCRRCK